ncbi:MAG: WD40 repeat domain-containing protein [Ktedonobacteraceae bacterium]
MSDPVFGMALSQAGEPGRLSHSLLWTGRQSTTINFVAFAPNGQMLASGGNDAPIRLWDVQRGTLLHTLSGGSGPVFALAWGPDGSLLASGGFDRHIRLWERPRAQSETLVQMLTGHTNWVVGLAFAPDGSRLASASWDGSVKLWDVESGRCLQTLVGCQRPRTFAPR